MSTLQQQYRNKYGLKAGLKSALALLLAISYIPVFAAKSWQPVQGHIMTRWAKQVSPQNPLPDYPRPQMQRKAWKNLNGLWDYTLTDKDAKEIPAPSAEQILVPYPYEAALSGVGKGSIPDKRIWYHRTFTVPAAWKGQHVLLHFGAVNWDSAIAVNGKAIGTHRGGYDGFTFDVTEALQPGENSLVVSAWNPVRSDVPNAQVLGKQRLRPGGIFYTAATGIWQTVWIEPVPAAYISDIKITPDIDANTLHVAVQSSSPATVKIIALDGSKSVATTTGQSDTDINLSIAAPRLWSPEDPHLYGLRVSVIQNGKPVDDVDSYFAMRKISLGKDSQGRNRIFLNNKFQFEMGVLDQGYWPDGIYTAPTDAALRYDIEAAKKLGINLLRKHAKVEPDRWYYWTDKLGMLVWQDMPQMFGGRGSALSDEANQRFDIELRHLIAGFYNHPSIIVWTTFNEGWGQHDTDRIVSLVKQLDPSRLVNNASGWNDMRVGDILDTHHYPVPFCEPPTADRASVNGEFGGLGMRVDDHAWAKGSWGYQGVYTQAYQLTRRYQQLLKTGYNFIEERGLSALVYTQLTDVEEESNGLLTYDRAIIKPDPVITSAANQGRFPPLPPNPHPDPVPISQDEQFSWRYTTDMHADDWSQTGFNDSDWKSGKAGFGQGVGNISTPWTTPDIWLRREVTLPASLPSKLAFLVFHDEDVEIYINGVLAASAKGYVGGYVQLPMNQAGRAALKPGKNLIAVHCHQTVGGQYIDVGITYAGK